MTDPRYLKGKPGTPTPPPDPYNPVVQMMECYADMAEYLRIIALYCMKKGQQEGLITDKEIEGEG